MPALRHLAVLALACLPLLGACEGRHQGTPASNAAASLSTAQKVSKVDADVRAELGKGDITISDDEDMDSEIALLAGGVVDYRPRIFSVDNKTGKEIETEVELTESAQSRDMIFSEVGDSTKTRGYGIQSNNQCLFCAAPVFIQQRFLDEGEAPLCGDHTDRKGEVASTPQPDGTWHHQVINIQPVQKSNLPAGG